MNIEHGTWKTKNKNGLKSVETGELQVIETYASASSALSTARSRLTSVMASLRAHCQMTRQFGRMNNSTKRAIVARRMRDARSNAGGQAAQAMLEIEGEGMDDANCYAGARSCE